MKLIFSMHRRQCIDVESVCGRREVVTLKSLKHAHASHQLHKPALRNPSAGKQEGINEAQAQYIPSSVKTKATYRTQLHYITLIFNITT